MDLGVRSLVFLGTERNGLLLFHTFLATMVYMFVHVLEFNTALSLPTLLMLLGLNACSYYEMFSSMFQELVGGSAWFEDSQYPTYSRLDGFLYPLVVFLPLKCMVY